jgi:hypothetical protein
MTTGVALSRESARPTTRPIRIRKLKGKKKIETPSKKFRGRDRKTHQQP